MNAGDEVAQTWLFTAFLLLAVFLFGYVTYLSWFAPCRFHQVIQFYARFHRRWNPEQFTWMGTKTFQSIMRFVVTLGFLLAIGVTILVLLKTS